MAWRQTVSDVVAKQQFQGGPSRRVNFLGFTLDHHARLEFSSAGGRQLAVSFDQANQAGVERSAFLQVTERGDVQAKGARGGEHGLVRGDLHAGAVDRYSKGGHMRAKPAGNPKSEIRNPKQTGNLKK